MNSRSKYWCVTNFDETNAFSEKLECLFEEGTIQYAVSGAETCPSTKRRHNQAYIEFSIRKRFSSVIGLLGRGTHIEPRKGSAFEARTYCCKDGAFKEWGEISVPEQGKRTDLREVQVCLDEGKDIAFIAQEFFGTYLRYQKGIQSYINLKSIKRTWKTTVWVLWGKTGTGKTRHVYDTVGFDNIYEHPGGQWFDGYIGQEVALFDDFGGSEFKLTYLLKLLDRYPMRVPVKGNFVNWAPKVVYITSNHPPEDWYPNGKEEHVNALLRRIDEIEHYE